MEQVTAPSQAGGKGDEIVLIWSGQHDAYWGPNRAGYYSWVSAGRYTRLEAEHATSHCGPEKKIKIVPESHASKQEHPNAR